MKDLDKDVFPTTWQLSIEDKLFFRNLYTSKKAKQYIEVVELRNKGMSFREISKKIGVYVSSVHMRYKNAIKALTALQAYPLKKEKLQKAIEYELAAAKEETEKAYGGCNNCYGKGYSTYHKPGATASTDIPDHEPLTRTVIEKPKRDISFCSCQRGQDLEKEFATAKAEGAREAENNSWLKMKKRCLLFGCVFGIPMVDKEPKKECIFCGEPGYIDQDEWINISPHESMQKAINNLIEEYKTPEAIQNYLDQLTNPSVKENE